MNNKHEIESLPGERQRLFGVDQNCLQIPLAWHQGSPACHQLVESVLIYISRHDLITLSGQEQ
ncbi:hypothetical protein NKJ72_14605 [Mesorhizobium sp. M0045]